MNELPRVPFAHLPTPIESMPRLSAELNGPAIFVKRDDQTGLAFGGNKTRKLEFLLAEAQAQGAKKLITAGAFQSNHCRQTAAAAARFGFSCTLVLAGIPTENVSANFLLDRLLGVEVVWADWETRVEALQEAYSKSKLNGEHPYLVPYGGSSPTGATGYAYAIREIKAQDLNPDWIVFATSSGGTQAGMMAGAELFGYEGNILGISIDEPEGELSDRVADLAARVCSKFGKHINFKPSNILINDEYNKAGYGVLTDREIGAVKLFARTEGLLLDPVYTGRAAGGLIDLVKKDFFSPDDTVLFWHTGGTPSLFADKYQELVNYF